MKSGVIKTDSTSISNLTYIDGDIKTEEDLIINGKIKGDVEVKNHDLLIGPSAKIKGNIYGKNITIRGQVQGEIHATGKVDIAQEAKFSGKIAGKSVSVAKGAYFDADVDLGRKPLEKEATEESPKITEQSETSKMKKA